MRSYQEHRRLERRKQRLSTPLTHERLVELLYYDRDTGIFTRKVARHKFPVGSIAGSMTVDGYIKLTIEDSYWSAHRLAWFYVFGSPPTLLIDHIDGNRSNNRISNLREVTYTQNRVNIHKSPYKGVMYIAHKQLWRGRVDRDGKRYYTSLYSTSIEASRSRELLIASIGSSAT